ncbi:ABC transporter permease [Phytoactinopolyspora endophytica]|uniref:ABC transporter permease n=1 Tax=Phytoactinopolyspora endophytica TaxID=1642495 RepID=UPI00101B73A5|nr:ABC transporter permease [Phytoactinopolyspora endophytica]
MSGIVDHEKAGPTAVGHEQSQYVYASQWRLMWWKFKKHRVAKWSLWALVAMYIVALAPNFFAPYGADTRFEGYQDAPPTLVRVIDDGTLAAPFVYGRERTLDTQTLQYEHVEDRGQRSTIQFFGRGEPYKLFGVIETDRRLFTTEAGEPPVLLLGTDRLGRDILSRIIYGSQISLTIGLVGVALGLVLGTLLGAISGYFGGVVDTIIQRVTEFILALPALPLWIALAAALPRDWSIIRTYFFIVVILSFISWTGLAREVRGKLLALREEDFVVAAKVAGASRRRIIFGHLVPSLTSHLIVVTTLAIPAMILGETALSFIGVGMQAPAVSWGTLLQDAQNVVAVTAHPWQLTPAIPVVLVVLCFNFLGDGLRDAADPYSR